MSTASEPVQVSQPNRRNIFYGIFSVLLAGVLLYFSLRGVEWRRVWDTIQHAEWLYLVIACLITCCSFFLRACRWRVLLNASARFSIGTVFGATMAGYLGNSFLPARAGEFIRSYIIGSRSDLSKTYVLTTALSERMVDAIVLVLASSVALLGVEHTPAWLAGVSRTTAIVAGAGLLAIAILPHTGGLVEQVLQKLPLPSGLRIRLAAFAEQIISGLRTFHSVGRLAGFAAFTAVIWTFDCFTAMAGARSLGITLSFPVALLLITAMGLGSALPSTPGYVGIYQFVTVSVLTPFGIEHDRALAYSFVSQAIGYVVVLALGLPALYSIKDWRNAIRDNSAS